MAEVQNPQPRQSPLAQSHPQVVSGFSLAMGELWEPPGCLGMERPWGRGASPVPPAARHGGSCAAPGGSISMSSFTPKIWAQDNTQATTSQPRPALPCPGVTLCHCPRVLQRLRVPAGCSGSCRQTHGRSARHLRSQQGLNPGSPFPTPLLKC